MTRPPLTDDDGEVRELTADDIASFRPIREIDPGFAAATRSRRPIVLSLDVDVVESILARGADYEARVEQVLRAAIDAGEL